MTEPKIVLSRYERDCPHNRNGMTPKINDFRVYVDGEFRAVFKKEYSGRGYRAYDVGGFPIHARDGYAPPHLGDLVASQAGFTNWVLDHLDAIPSFAEAEAREIRRNHAKAVMEAAKARFSPTTARRVEFLPGVDEAFLAHARQVQADYEAAVVEREALLALIDKRWTHVERDQAAKAAFEAWLAKNEITLDDLGIRVGSYGYAADLVNTI